MLVFNTCFLRKEDGKSWDMLQVIFDPSGDTKKTWYAIEYPWCANVESDDKAEREKDGGSDDKKDQDKSDETETETGAGSGGTALAGPKGDPPKCAISARDLVIEGSKKDILVLGGGQSFQSVLDHATESLTTMYVPIETSPLPDFRLTFFGNAGLEAKGGSVVSLTSIMSPTDSNAPSLPWFLYGTHFDNVISCEVVCPAWLIPAKKFKNTFAEREKEREKAKHQSEEGKKIEFAGIDYDPDERCSSKGQRKGKSQGQRKGKSKGEGEDSQEW